MIIIRHLQVENQKNLTIFTKNPIFFIKNPSKSPKSLAMHTQTHQSSVPIFVIIYNKTSNNMQAIRTKKYTKSTQIIKKIPQTHWQSSEF